MNKLLKELGVDYLLVNSTNKYLVEYSCLSENARYTLTGFSGSTGDALVCEDNIYLFVDGRYHTQADNEEEEIRKIINPNKILGIVSKKVSQSRLEGFCGFKTKLLENDPINDYTEKHTEKHEKAFKPVEYRPKATFVSNLEEVSYLTGLRDFSKDNSSKIWSKLFIEGEKRILFDYLPLNMHRLQL